MSESNWCLDATPQRPPRPRLKRKEFGWLMASLKTTAVLLASTMVTPSCATPALWKATDPGKYLRVSRDDVDEARLQRQGVDYHSGDDPRVLFVEKSKSQKTGDWLARVFLTPLAATADVVAIASLIIPILYVADLQDRCTEGCSAEDLVPWKSEDE